MINVTKIMTMMKRMLMPPYNSLSHHLPSDHIRPSVHQLLDEGLHPGITLCICVTTKTTTTKTTTNEKTTRKREKKKCMFCFEEMAM